MTPEAELRMRIYQEGQRAFSSGARCPYIDWRRGTWKKGYDAAKEHYEKLRAELEKEEREAAARPQPEEPAPIDMILHCPKCHRQHIDEPDTNESWGDQLCIGNEIDGVHGGNFSGPRLATCAYCGKEPWTNPPHRSHLCHHCGTIWRPSDVPTNGVAHIQTRGKADTWPEV